MAPFYNSSQSKKLQPNVSLDERLDICDRALLNNLFRVQTNGLFLIGTRSPYQTIFEFRSYLKDQLGRPVHRNDVPTSLITMTIIETSRK